jgi:hypothetical protein
MRIACVDSVHDFPQVGQMPDDRSRRAPRGNARGL